VPAARRLSERQQSNDAAATGNTQQFVLKQQFVFQ